MSKGSVIIFNKPGFDFQHFIISKIKGNKFFFCFNDKDNIMKTKFELSSPLISHNITSIILY